MSEERKAYSETMSEEKNTSEERKL